jgi:hypothetical protein
VNARILVLAFALAACGTDPAPIRQPIEFSHKIHVGEQEVPCTDCHVDAERGVHATLPALSQCLLCHMKPQVSEPGAEPDPREHLVRELAASGAPARWIQITRNPGHVYFSHRAHVSLADMPCSDCHGDVSTWDVPPTRPNPRLLSMGACLTCHREQDAPTTCDTCHQ